jgi:catechol 2,3-dioxygenase-like lactoylglutathione lyase family enzyme
MKFNKLVPELSVSNLQKSLEFYIKMLGFKIEYQREEKRFAFVSLNGSQLMLDEIKPGKTDWDTGELDPPLGRGINFQIEVDNIDSLLASLNNYGYNIFIEPKDNWYRKEDQFVGNREFLVQDPDGYLLRFAQDLGYKNI